MPGPQLSRPIDLFDAAVANFPDRIALDDGEVRYSYRALQIASERVAGELLDAGLCVGEPVAMWSPNSASVLVCMLAVMRAAAVWAPVNAGSGPSGARAYLQSFDPRWLFYAESVAQQVEEFASAGGKVTCTICLDDAPHARGLAERVRAAAAKSRPPIDIAAARTADADLVALIPTGGTTGASRAVAQSRPVFDRLISTLAAHLDPPGECVACLSVAPLSHSAGAQAFAAFTVGGRNQVMQTFTATAVLDAIERYRVTHLFLPPTGLYFLLAHPDVLRRDHSSLRSLRIGGAAMGSTKLQEAVRVFGPCVCLTYGQIEAPILAWHQSSDVAAAVGGRHRERVASCGTATDGVELAIVNDDGDRLAIGELGEIAARGPAVACSYFPNKAKESPSASAWHRTGDLGRLDADGYLYITGRKRDLIVSGGINLHPAEIEATILEVPGVKECAVVAVPDELLGESVKAIVVRQENSEVSVRSIVRHCRQELGASRAPRSVEFWSDLPRTGVGKIDKLSIRERYWS